MTGSKTIVAIVVSIVILIIAVVFAINYRVPRYVCGAGECPTNILTGTKRCPSDGQSSTYDPSSEVCNSIDLCDNPITKFSVLPNGSTSDTGVCANTECSCSTSRMCSSWTAVAFKDDGFKVDQLDLSGDRLLPVGYSCAMPIESIQRLGCPFSGGTTSSIKQDIKLCSALYADCGEIPLCTRGDLAIIDDGIASRYMCVTSSPCPCGSPTFIDPVSGVMTCG